MQPEKPNMGRWRNHTMPVLIIGTLIVLANGAMASDFEARAERIINNLASVTVPAPGGTGKLPYGWAIAHLERSGGQDPAALAYIAESGYGGEIFFNSIMQLRGLYMGRDHFTAAQLNRVVTDASADNNNWRNMGTENHRKMTWSSAYLLAQFFPNATWNWGGERISSARMKEEVKQLFISVGRNEYRGGYSEFLSPNYLIYHMAPMINLYDYAEDPEMRAIAEAFLLYHFTVLAKGSFEEVVLPPWSRHAGVMDRNLFGADTQLLLWLYWGHGDFPQGREFPAWNPLVHFALSDWRLPEAIQRFGDRDVELPYTVWTQQTHWQWNPLRYVMRTTFQHERYAMSSGVIRHVPGAFMLDDAQFMIAWQGGSPIRQIQAFHPYWRAITEGENFWISPTSPFMQTGQHKDAAIMLFNIPAEDPWPRTGRQEWWIHRDGPLIPLGQVRFPSHMTVVNESGDNWVYLRDGSVYVAIKVLKDGWVRDRRSVTESLPDGTVVGFNVLKSGGTVGEPWQTGFIFQVGSADEFGSFEDFQAEVAALPFAVDWDNLTATFTSLRGDVLELRYNTSMQTPDNTIPFFSINQRPVAFDATWPVLASPWVNIQDHLFVIELPGADAIAVNWQNDIPLIGSPADVLPTRWGGFDVDPSGWIFTGEFLGDLFLYGDFLWSDRLQRIIFAPSENVGPSGGWIYIPRP